MMVLPQLLIAHFIGDFFVQPTSWVRAKEERKLTAWQLYVHSVLHGGLAWLLVFETGFWKWAIVVAVVHFLIDALKLLFQNENTKRSWFFIDQLLHLISLYLIWLWYSGPVIVFPANGWLVITLLLFLTNPCSFTIKTFINKWGPFTGDTIDGSLQSAGKYIGIFERLFVFAFVVTGNWQGIAFLITAKSVFRFGDLKEAKDRKLTEYILIGTLASFGLAMLAGSIYLRFKKVIITE